MNTKKIINIFIFVFIIISIFLLVYTHYKSEFVYDSKRLSNYIVYYVFSILGIIFFSTLLILNQKLKENILVTLTTFIILFYISEGVLFFFNKDNLKKDDIQVNEDRRLNRAKLIYKNYNIEVETRSQLEFKEHLNSQGIEVFLMVTPHRMLGTDGIKNFYPLSGKSHKLTLGGAETGKYITYKSDRYGFNNPDEEWDKKIDIVVIGDSNIHSNHLKREDGYVGKLKELTNKSIINLGIGNNGPLIELATLKEYAKKLKPKVILWVYCEDNDLIELKSEIKSKILSQYLNKDFSQNLINNQNLIEKNYDNFIKERINERNTKLKSLAFSIDNKTNYNLLSFIKLIEIRKILFDNLIDNWRSRVTKKDLNIFKEILSEAKKTTESFGGEFYFVYLPASTRFVDNYTYHLKKNDYLREEILGIVNELEIKNIDLWKLYFENLEDPLSTLHFRMHSHYNKETVEILTKKIVQVLEK